MATEMEKRMNELANGDVVLQSKQGIFKILKTFFFKTLICLTIYAVGYFELSIAWLATPLILTVLGRHWREERDSRLTAARQAALSSEQKMIESRLKIEELPSWVFFPDKERAEWINNILKQLWPNVGHYARKLICETIEPTIKSALESYSLGGFRFQKVVLGQIPPRISSIKVYEKNVKRNEIIIDVDVIFASDCDIQFSLKGITAKLSNFSLRGLVRIVLKPLISDLPLIGGVSVYFLTYPEVDFDLGGVANILDVPGLSHIIRQIVIEQIGAFVVLPNKYTLSLTHGVEPYQLKLPKAAGVLRVHLKKAEKLAKKDVGVLGMGKSDPYAVLSVGARKKKTPTINNNINPEWDYVGDFPIEVVQGQQLSIEVWDHDDHGVDEALGRATIATELVASKGEIHDIWMELEEVPTGRLFLSLFWLEVSDDKSFDCDTTELSGVGDTPARALITVYVDSCQGLYHPKNNDRLPSPCVELNVGARTPQRTWVKADTSEPVFEQGFMFLVSNPSMDDLHIKVLDMGKNGSVLGLLDLPISSMLRQPNMEISPPQAFNLKDSSSVISLSCSLKFLMKPGSNVAKDSIDNDVLSEKFAASTKPTADIVESGEAKTNLEQINNAESVAPSLDEAMHGMIDPMVATTMVFDADRNISLRTSELRQRRQQTSSKGFGKIKLTLRYDPNNEVFHVTIVEVNGLPGADLIDLPDPYVKLYLLPDRSKKSKRKTEAKKDVVNTVYDETFHYENMSLLDMKRHSLEVSVVDKKGLFARGSVMGRLKIDLSSLVTAANFNILDKWFDLEEADDDSD